MADINPSADCENHTDGQDAKDLHLDAIQIAFIELLFFAYRDFTSESDAILQRYGFGRAHHRVLHFVHRKPGLTVAELLTILKITKQSLARVLKQLIAEGFIEQKAGALDRRQRLLYVAEKGRKLSLELAERQTQRVQAALHKAGPHGHEAVSKFLLTMVAKQNRPDVMELIGKVSLLSAMGDSDKIF